MDEYGFDVDVMEAGDLAAGRACRRAVREVDGETFGGPFGGPRHDPEQGFVRHPGGRRPWDTGR